MESVSGRHPYASMAYAETLSHVGRAFGVPGWNASVILRSVPSHPDVSDVMGLHPLCVLEGARDVAGGLWALRELGLASVVAVSDPLAPEGAPACFGGMGFRRPFKTHQVIDRTQGAVAPSKHHRDRMRRASRRVSVYEVSLADPAWRRHWGRLYAGQVAHRRTCGLHDFPAASCDALAALPMGQVAAFAASDGAGEVHAMQIWVVQGDR